MTDTCTPENARTFPNEFHYTAPSRLFYRLAFGAIASGYIEPREARAVTLDLLAGRISAARVVNRPNTGGLPPQTYFMQMQVPGRAGPIKIGSSGAPDRRREDLSCGSPYPVVLLAWYPGDILDEAELHTAFERTRLRGEWFRPTPRLLAFVEFIHGLPA